MDQTPAAVDLQVQRLDQRHLVVRVAVVLSSFRLQVSLLLSGLLAFGEHGLEESRPGWNTHTGMAGFTRTKCWSIDSL